MSKLEQTGKRVREEEVSLSRCTSMYRVTGKLERVGNQRHGQMWESDIEM